MTLFSISAQEASLKVGCCTVLDHANFNLNLKGITLLRGENGAGKTSFLRALLGLESLKSGSLHIFNTSPKKARNHIGYMPQKTKDYAPMLPVLSHVIASITGMKWGISFSKRPHYEAMRLLSLTQSEHLASRPIGVLSGGERQRVALTQALVHQPYLLILDEPLAALDTQARSDTMILLNDLSRRFNIALLITAHEKINIKTLPIREIWLKEGILHV